jgi:AcrR family transcriptional regulator
LSSPAGPRRAPTQDRSRLRVERILNVAGEVFAEKGYDAATTEEIAERAEISIGSFYQYFPNKDALFDAIADQYIARSREVFELHLTAAAAAGGTWQEVIDRAIDAFDFLQRTENGFRAVWMNWTRSARFLVAGVALNAEFAERTEAVLGMHAPELSPQRRRLVATMIIEVISSMLFVAIRSGDELGHEIIEETKVLLRRYLAPIVSSPKDDE